MRHIEIPKPESSEELGLYFTTHRTMDGDLLSSSLSGDEAHTTNHTPHWCKKHRRAYATECSACQVESAPPIKSKPTEQLGWQTLEEQRVAKKKRTTKRSPKTHAKTNGSNGKANGSNGKDRAGMTERDLSDDERAERGEQLARSYQEIEKKLEKKRQFNRVTNEEIRALEDQCKDLSEQVETGREWVPAQQSIPGA